MTADSDQFKNKLYKFRCGPEKLMGQASVIHHDKNFLGGPAGTQLLRVIHKSFKGFKRFWYLSSNEVERKIQIRTNMLLWEVLRY